MLQQLDGDVRAGRTNGLRGIPTGFSPLDTYLHGGVRVGELFLVGGAQGVGKSTWALQLARHVAAGGHGRALYVCYEHSEEFLLERLIAMESALAGEEAPVSVGDLRDLLAGNTRNGNHHGGIGELLAELGHTRPVLERLAAYEERLFLVKAGAMTTVEAIGSLARACPGEGPLVVIVDYLQKVSVFPDPPSEEEQVRRSVEGLKELAMSQSVAAIAVVAADAEGVKAQRMRIHHLRGDTALAYEADVVLILNDKHRAVARHHVVYQPNVAEGFHGWVVFSLEKNRGGVDGIDFELRKRFAHACFDPAGGFLSEQLVDGRLYLT
ncbi:MAG TPA: DnaB-like helicase C-terminal domain-containing protein [Actinomycetes bacterium]|nr:DnaB-like helicase C-terminal domain-containing protein [Actinomycetes bacterium]